MLKLSKVFFSALFLLSGCGEDSLVEGTEEESLSTDVESTELRVQEGVNSPYYYYVRRDMRRCASPWCGGYFVEPVNKRRMKCWDGRWEKECYVSGVDWSPLGLQEGQEDTMTQDVSVLVVYGVLTQAHEAPGELTVTKAWHRKGGEEGSRGVLQRLVNEHIVCISSPCFSYSKQVIGSRRSVPISGLDGEESMVLSVATALSEEEVLATGHVHRTRQLSGMGRVFVLDTAYLPVLPLSIY